MSKYIITVKEVLDDGTKKPFYFDKEGTERKIKADGFAIIGVNHGGGDHAISSTYAFNDISPLILAEAMHDCDVTREAAIRLVEAALRGEIRYPDNEEDDDAAD